MAPNPRNGTTIVNSLELDINICIASHRRSPSPFITTMKNHYNYAYTTDIRLQKTQKNN